MKVYVGIREKDGTLSVTVNGQPLNPRFDLWNHSPTGFECGYGGSGPAQLALALLADHLNKDEEAVTLHQLFKREVVASQPFTTRLDPHKQADRMGIAIPAALRR